jgi:hypothetical protein
MREIKLGFEARMRVNLRLTSGVSRFWPRILKGRRLRRRAPRACVSTKPMNKKIAGSGQDAATGTVVFRQRNGSSSSPKNPLGIREVSDLLRPQVRFVRINGEKDRHGTHDRIREARAARK